MAASSAQLIFLLLLAVLAAASSRNDEEARALMALKESLDPAGRVLGSWARSGEPCGGSFVGVTCDSGGRVTAISLQGRGLSGTLPPAIAGLRRLTGLYLHYNGIKGAIPREIGSLSELTDLYLDVNHLTGPLPVEIAAMENLQGEVSMLRSSVLVLFRLQDCISWVEPSFFLLGRWGLHLIYGSLFS